MTILRINSIVQKVLRKMKIIVPTFILYLLGMLAFTQELVPFQADNFLWGYKDKTGKEIIAPQYDGAKEFKDGLASIRIKCRWGFIDATGKEIIGTKYDETADFSEGLARLSPL